MWIPLAPDRPGRSLAVKHQHINDTEFPQHGAHWAHHSASLERVWGRSKGCFPQSGFEVPTVLQWDRVIYA